MKKIIATILSLICLISVTALGCASESQKEYGYLDLSKYEVGDELPIYPNYEFSYKLNDTITITIIDANVTLEDIDVVEESGIITEEYYAPYEIKVSLNGYATPQIDNDTIRVHYQSGILSLYVDATIDENFNFSGETLIQIRYYSPLLFLSATTDF